MILISKYHVYQPEIITNYAKKERYIPRRLYNEIKSRKKCKLCGVKKHGKNFEIHHKIPVSQGGENDYKNLILVCPDCHKKLHQEDDKNG